MACCVEEEEDDDEDEEDEDEDEEEEDVSSVPVLCGGAELRVAFG